jgi:hypothetical protein
MKTKNSPPNCLSPYYNAVVIREKRWTDTVAIALLVWFWMGGQDSGGCGDCSLLLGKSKRLGCTSRKLRRANSPYGPDFQLKKHGHGEVAHRRLDKQRVRGEQQRASPRIGNFQADDLGLHTQLPLPASIDVIKSHFSYYFAGAPVTVILPLLP